MNTDIAIPNGHGDLVGFGAPSDALARLGQWVEAAHHAHQLVAPLVGTAFVPDAYKPKVDPRATPEQKTAARETAIANATAAVLQGITLGLDPMTALQQIYVVHGRPGMYTRIKVALVQSKGHDVWTEDLSDTRAVVCGRRKGNDAVERVTVTMDQARKAGWTTNAAYAKTPQDMLWARAAGRVCDRIAPDALMGIASVEEIQDELAPATGNGTRTVGPSQQTRARAAGRTLPAAAEPPLEDDGANMEPTVADEPPATQAQTRKLYALLKENELGDKASGLAYISGIVDRDITSTKELTKSEAGTVIDRLERNAAATEPPLDEAVAIALADDEPQLWPDTTQPPAGEQ